MATEKQHHPRRPLPGEPVLDKAIEAMIRVDHAGEFGAARIYDGQLAVFGKNHRHTPAIRKIADQEQEHLECFEKLLTERAVRPTLLGPVWDVAGFALGAVTALMGEKAAMACTVAVEDVIEEHYQSQLDDLKNWRSEPDLAKTIAKFRKDELEHRDTAIEYGAEQATGYKLLSGLIKSGCRSAIWLSKRI